MKKELIEMMKNKMNTLVKNLKKKEYVQDKLVTVVADILVMGIGVAVAFVLRMMYFQ